MARKLTYDFCTEVARDCKTRGQLERKDISVYNKALKEGWLKKWDWLRSSLRELSYEYCTEVARGCETRGQLARKDSTVYCKALKEGWLKKWSWLKLNERNNGKIFWTRELVQEKANECIKAGMCLHDFEKKYPGAHNRAKTEGYLQELGFEKRVTIFNGKNAVYSYEFKDGSVYIGRTIDIDRRDREHRNKEKDAVYKYSKQSGLEIPNVKILKIVDTIEESLIWEDRCKEKYKEKGWNILNKAKTGIKSGSRGGIGRRYLWSEKNIRELVKKRNFKNVSQMQREESGAYDAAWEMGIIDDLFPDKHKERSVYKVEGYKYTFYYSISNCAKMNEGFNSGIRSALSENRKYKGVTVRYLNIKEQE